MFAYTATQIQPGQYTVLDDTGKSIANVSDEGLSQYGLAPGNLGTPVKAAATSSSTTPVSSVPTGWDATTYANFKAANPNLEPTPEDTLRMQLTGAGATPDQINSYISGLPPVSPTNSGASVLPSNLGATLGVSGSTPSPTTPVPVGSLPTTSGGNSNVADAISSVLNPTAGSSPSSSIAGILSLLTQPSDEDTNYSNIANTLSSLQSQLGNEGPDEQSQLDSAGVSSMTNQLQELTVQAAQQSSALNSFDAETQQGLSDLDNQQIPDGLVQGQQAAYQKQRDLTRLSMAAEASATAALAQAYQGNIDTATKLVQQSITLKYQPITDEITALQTQLSAAKDSMTTEDSKTADIVSALLDYQKTQITTQQDNDTKVQTLAVTAASNGAPLSVVNAIKNSPDPVSAAQAGAKYLGSTSPIYNGGGTGGATSFTTTQINKGASNAGISTSDFNGLDPEVKNFFVNNATGVTAFHTLLTGVANGSQNSQDAISTVNSSATLPASVKTYLIQQINSTAPAGGGSSFESKALNVASSVGNFLKGILGF